MISGLLAIGYNKLPIMPRYLVQRQTLNMISGLLAIGYNKLPIMPRYLVQRQTLNMISGLLAIGYNKLPIMPRYLVLSTDSHSLSFVIINGDSPIPTIVVDGVVQPVSHKSVDQKLVRRNELKAHGTLLMALPDKHQLKVNSHKDAKTLMEAIEKRLGGNTETEKIDVDDLEEMDLKWQMAMLTMRARRSPKDSRRSSATEPQKRTAPVENSTSNALVSQCDVIGSYDWSYQAEEDPTNYALMAITSSSSFSNNETNEKHGLGYFSLESDSESLSPSSPSDRLQPSGRYHVVPPPITGTFMPPKPDLVFHTTPIDVKTGHSAFTSVPSFVQSSEQVKTPRHSVQPVKVPILDATLQSTSLKSNSSSKRRNRKTCFVCRMLTQSKPVHITTVRPISAAMPKIIVTRPRHAHSIDTKSKSPIRSHITRSPSPKISHSPPRVTAAQASVVRVAKGKKGKWVAILNKSKASEGFNQIIDFLNGSYIQLQALVDRKKVVLTEIVIRDILRLDDADGVDYLTNEEIFAGLARMGYEKPSIKLTFYKAFFLSQLKFLIHTILQSMSAKRTSWNEFSSATASAVICLSTGSIYSITCSTHSTTITTSRYSIHIPSTIPPPLPQSPAPAQPHGTDFPTSLLQEALDACAALTRRVEHLEHDKVAQDLEITKLKTRVKKLERANKVKTLKLKRLRKVRTSQRIKSSNDIAMEDASNHIRMIAELDRDEGIALMDDEGAEKKTEDAHVADDEQVKGRQVDIYQIGMEHAVKVLSMQEDEPKVQEAVKVVTTAKMITKVVAVVSESISAANANIDVVPAATITAVPVRVVAAFTRRRKGVVIRDPKKESIAKIPDETKSKDKGKGIMVEKPKPIKKKQQVKMDEAYARKLHEDLNQDIDWDVAIDHVKQKAKEDSYVQRLDYFKGMYYDDIHLIFEAKFNLNIEFLLKSKEQIEEEENRAIESINKTPAQKAAKRKKLNEEVKDVEEIKQHLEIVPDEDDDVYTEATPLARKVPAVDYQIIQLNNKPRYKIITADETHHLAMFGRPDGQDQVWKSQRSVHGQAKLILLLERRHPLSRFTLDQMLNAVRLQVEEQSEMYLELIRVKDPKSKDLSLIFKGSSTMPFSRFFFSVALIASSSSKSSSTKVDVLEGRGVSPLSGFGSYPRFFFSVALIASSLSKSSSTKVDVLKGRGVSSNVTLSDALTFLVCLLRMM
uniref:Uncharacterized protein n=1 Tax=Tanacetum cinerariifolium TaxID=118510 RepID=A0A6L2LNX8_TANCI|nr:hypothetical protein [Tanacetum cinerariifolium]